MAKLDLGKVVPEKGIDYYTNADKEEMKEMVLDEIVIPTKVSELENDNNYIDNTVNDLVNYELKTNTGSTIELTIDSSTYIVTLNLKNSAGTIISTGNIDLPLETMVVSASYDNTTKEIVLTLKNGNTVRFSVADLVSGLQSEITSNNKLSSDLVDDTNNTNKFVTESEKTTWNNKSEFSGDYTDLTNKPTIPDELADLQDDSTHRTVTDTEKTTWNGKANTEDIPTKTSDLTNDSGFLTSYTETDPIFTASASAGITSNDISNWNNKQNALTFDSTPTQNSTNPVTSNGVYEALQNVGGGLPVTVISSSTTLAIETANPGFYYVTKGGNSGYGDDTTFTISISDGNSYTFYTNGKYDQLLELIIFKKYSETVGNETFAYLSYIKNSDGQIYIVRMKNGAGSSFPTGPVIFQNSASSVFMKANKRTTISGKFTYSTLPESSITPTTANQLTNKDYVDTQISTQVGNIQTVLNSLVTVEEE